jgi:hypothetical protein
MDDIVKQAMAKWPQVPDCYGWLGFDDRGDWYMRDDGVQAQGDFAQAKGSKLAHTQLIAFIERNYACDPFGRWYFQNGPQRVFVELQSVPFVWRVLDSGLLTGAQGDLLDLMECLVDENGRLYALTAKGLGLIHSMDTWHAAKALEEKQWPAAKEVGSAQLVVDYGYMLSPAKGEKKPALKPVI